MSSPTTRGLVEIFAGTKGIIGPLQILDRATGAPYDLTQHGGYTATFKARKPDDAAGSSFISLPAALVLAAQGIVQVAYTAAISMPSGYDVVDGSWTIRLTATDGTRDFPTLPLPFILRRLLFW